MRSSTLLLCASAALLLLSPSVGTARCAEIDPNLEAGWARPPLSARVRAYWWWLNGNVTAAALTRDLEEFKAKGWGGALICDADGASQDGNDRVRHGPTFFTPEWRELYRHALKEADRLGLEMSLNIQSGWNLGGPMVTADDAAKKLVWSEARTTGPGAFDETLPAPQSRDGYYRDLFVVAYPLKPDAGAAGRARLQNWEQKAMHRALHFSAPDTTPLLVESPDVLGEADTGSSGVVDLTSGLEPGGRLRWSVPEGTWQILRFGCTIGDHSRVSTSSDGWKGYALDVLDAGAFERYWDAVVEPLIRDAGPLAGRALKYPHTASWEVEAVNWTPTLREEFRQQRGYDLVPFLPVLAGRLVESRSISHRFLHDFRRTLGDLAVDHHFRLFRDRAHARGLEIHPESGGPHAVPIDAQRCLGVNDVPMSEFWAWSWRHRVGDTNRFFVKQPASAAHTYGRRLVAAEGFTTIGPHWQETIWDNLKPSFDRALCEGLNLLVWHAVVCSPQEEGLPGIQYFAGTHFNPNTTWWPQSGPFIQYINRCQWLLQQGFFVADASYYYGDHVPNFAHLKRSDPARVLPGHDYDVLSEEALIERVSVRQGRLVLPDGMSYALLVLPDRPAISLPALRHLRTLVRAGATILGPKPASATGLVGYPASDIEVQRLADELWEGAGSADSRRVIADKTAREVLAGLGVRPDFEYLGVDPQTTLDHVHRRTGDADIYFVANRSNRWEEARCTFRVEGKTPEIWQPETGAIRGVLAWDASDGQTTVPLQFEPYGSLFVVFRKGGEPRVASVTRNGQPVRALASASELEGAVELWDEAGISQFSAVEPGRYALSLAEGREITLDMPAVPAAVSLDRDWILHVPVGDATGATRSVPIEALQSWTRFEDPVLRYYSGTLEYTRSLEVDAGWVARSGRVFVELGVVHEVAEVVLNGQQFEPVWKPPFRVDVTRALRPGVNRLRIRVTNFWPNRVIGDQSLPPDRRSTRTNVRKLTAETPLMASGLLGPVRLLGTSLREVR